MKVGTTALLIGMASIVSGCDMAPPRSGEVWDLERVGFAGVGNPHPRMEIKTVGRTEVVSGCAATGFTAENNSSIALFKLENLKQGLAGCPSNRSAAAQQFEQLLRECTWHSCSFSRGLLDGALTIQGGSGDFAFRQIHEAA